MRDNNIYMNNINMNSWMGNIKNSMRDAKIPMRDTKIHDLLERSVHMLCTFYCIVQVHGHVLHIYCHHRYLSITIEYTIADHIMTSSNIDGVIHKISK